MDVYLIRHTRPDVIEGTCYGQSDIPLADSFEEESGRLLEKLPERFCAVFTSPLSRCLRLAQKLKTDNLIEHEHLKELNFGQWEMKEFAELKSIPFDRWMKNYVRERTPDGESFEDLFHRANKTLDEIIQDNHTNVAVITHAGVLKAVFAKILNISLEASFQLFFNYGSVSLIRVDDSFKQVRYINR